MAKTAEKNRATSAQDDSPSGGNGAPSAPASAYVDLPRIERAVREILSAVGEDPDREGLLEAPARVARMYAEMFSGLKQDPRMHTQKFFTEEYDEVVLVRDISFCSMCVHHLVPLNVNGTPTRFAGPAGLTASKLLVKSSSNSSSAGRSASARQWQ